MSAIIEDIVSRQNNVRKKDSCMHVIVVTSRHGKLTAFSGKLS